MPLTQEYDFIDSYKFFTPLRAIFSGSSGSGKTYLVSEILKNQDRLFDKKFTAIDYYYPKFLDESPVSFHQFLDCNVTYTSGFPTESNILNTEQGGLIIIDDQADQAVKSDLIATLFKVISGKKNISVILITQNYFVQGKHSREIRNSCNYVCLFRNCADASINKRACSAFGLQKAYKAAELDIRKKVYSYLFIDQTQKAQVTPYRLYTNILSPRRIVYSVDGMKGYVLNEKDFLKTFKILEIRESSVVVNQYEDKSKQLRSKDSCGKHKKDKKRKIVQSDIIR